MKSSKRKSVIRQGCPTCAVITRAQEGDGEALMAIVRYFDPYLRYVATRRVDGVRAFDADLYERLKAKVLWVAFKFKFDPSGVTAEEIAAAEAEIEAGGAMA